MTAVPPQWEPPTGLTDPFVRRQLTARAQWCRATRGRIPELREQAVALRVSDYSNKDGRNAHPGVARIAADTCTSDRTVRRALSWLAEHGWLTVTRRGRRKLGEADVYALTVPAPVAAELGTWTTESVPEPHSQWIERPTNQPKRPELRRDTRRFPAANSDRCNSFLAANSEFLAANSDVLAANVGLPPGLTTPGPTTTFSDSIAASHASVRGTATLIDYDDEEELLRVVEERIGRAPGPDTEALVLGMLANGKNWRAILNAAVKHEET